MSEAGFPSTLRDAFETSLGKYPDRTAVVGVEETVSYRDLDRRSNALANALADRGVDRGERVGVLMGNSVAFVVGRVAIIKLGATFVPINPALAVDDVAYVLDHSGTGTLLCDAPLLDWAADAMAGATDLSRLVFVRRVGSTADAVGECPVDETWAYEDLLDDGARDAPPAVSPSPSDSAGIHYTGGTTGRPKGVVHTERSRTVNLLAHVVEFGLTGTERTLLATPLTHAARLFCKASLLVGATVVLRDGFEADQWMQDVERHAVTTTFVVPTMLYRVLDEVDLEPVDTTSLSTVVYGAAPITPDRLREALDAFGPVFVQLYGQTEVPDLITTLGKREHELALDPEGGPDEAILGSAGQPCLFSDVVIRALDGDEPVPVGEPGEVVASAPYVLDRYLDAPGKTAETLRDGWVRTGDVGRIDEDGYLYLLDRTHDVVVTGGMNVYTTQVEDVLADHPTVRECAVIGVPDPEWGEAVTAFVVPYDRSRFDVGGLRSFVGEHLADYEQPKTVEVVASLPRTQYGKTDKAALREPYWEDAERRVN